MKIKKYILGSILVVVLFCQSSCKKEFLEIEPKGSAIARTTTDYEQILNGLYISRIETASAFLGDDVAVMQPYFAGASLKTQRLFRYDERIYDTDDVPDEIDGEESYIRRLYLYNKIINEVMDSREGTDAQKRSISAQAKVGRAICNLLFLTDFSKPYNASSAATDLGIPNLTENDVTLKDFTRLSQKQNFEQMTNDLSSAIPDLDVLVHRRKISKLAAYFFLARVYLIMGNFPDAKVNLDLAFTEVQKSDIPVALYDYTQLLGPNGEWTPVGDFGMPGTLDNPANNEQVIYNLSANVHSFGSANTFLTTPRVAALWDSQDSRLMLYPKNEFFDVSVFPQGMRRIQFALSGVEVGAQISDLYLMRAECRARTGELALAVSDVEELRRHRTVNYRVPTATANNQQSLVRFILDERLREFALTGLRWTDMRRLSVDDIYKDHIDYKHHAYDAEGKIVSTWDLTNNRFALKFGERMLRESNSLQENP
jgi:hypothetical protein